MVASSSDAEQRRSRYSSTYEGTMALPLTAFTRSFRTTTPGKRRLIFRSSSLCGGAESTGMSDSTDASRLTSLTSLMAASSLEVEVRGERAFQRIHRLG